ncbi:hypothetical protein U1Q18_005021 [Sarracenia purpurea var. burkii]
MEDLPFPMGMVSLSRSFPTSTMKNMMGISGTSRVSPTTSGEICAKDDGKTKNASPIRVAGTGPSRMGDEGAILRDKRGVSPLVEPIEEMKGGPKGEASPAKGGFTTIQMIIDSEGDSEQIHEVDDETFYRQALIDKAMANETVERYQKMMTLRREKGKGVASSRQEEKGKDKIDTRFEGMRSSRMFVPSSVQERRSF